MVIFRELGAAGSCEDLHSSRAAGGSAQERTTPRPAVKLDATRAVIASIKAFAIMYYRRLLEKAGNES